MNLRAKVTETMGKVPAERAYSDVYPFYYRDFRENLYCPMGEQAYRAYEEGRGGELEPYTRFGKLCPPKMDSVASSSAMTFNLLGNDPATILLMPQEKREYLRRYFA